MVDWLETTKAPRWVAGLGESMGADSLLAEAVADPRIRALILASTHAHQATAAGRVLVVDDKVPDFPAAGAILAGVSLAIGFDVSAIDAVNLLPRLGDRPVLFVHGTDDPIDRPADSVLVNAQVASSAGVPVQLELCPGADHTTVPQVCASQLEGWLTSFLNAAELGAGPPG
jgi:pimeloyl-ACP methyl ester carboxylesterase